MSEQNHALEQAQAQYDCISNFVAALDIDWDRFEELRTAKDDTQELTELEEIVRGYSGWKSKDDVAETIQQDPLEVSVRNTSWYAPGSKPEEPDEYRILLCTGGPAVQITGRLDDNNEPESAEIQYQDWGTPWTRHYEGVSEEVLLKYARQFYFGE